MKKSKMLKAFLVVLSAVLLLSSCSMLGENVGKATGEMAKPTNKVVMTIYVSSVIVDAYGEQSGIGSAGADASERAVQECIQLLKTDALLSDVAEAVGFSNASELKAMLSIEPVNDTRLLKVTLASKDYSAEQLLLIGDAFIYAAPDYVRQVMRGTVDVAPVDTPFIVE